MAAAKIRKGDRVVVLTGKDKGKTGEQVRIEECAPISKLKSWTVLDRVGAAPVAVETVEAKPAKTVKGKAKAEPAAAEA
jgi:small subunit ribosomal protein S17